MKDDLAAIWALVLVAFVISLMLAWITCKLIFDAVAYFVGTSVEVSRSLARSIEEHYKEK